MQNYKKSADETRYDQLLDILDNKDTLSASEMVEMRAILRRKPYLKGSARWEGPSA